MSKLEEIVQSIKDKAALEKSGYEVFGEGDRHGSSEVTWSKKEGAVTRFVVLAATPEDFTPRYSVEVWAGVDHDDGRFTRSLFASFKSVELNRLKSGPLLEAVMDALRHAIFRANDINEHELINRRIPQASRK